MEAQKMTLAEARQILGNRPRWELLQIKRALSRLELLNTPQEAQRLEAAKVLLAAQPQPWA